MAKIRVYELARELGKENKALEDVIRGLGIEIKNYMSTLAPEEADQVRQRLGGGPPPSEPGRRSAPIRRRGTAPRRPEEGGEPMVEPAPAPVAAPPSPVLRRSAEGVPSRDGPRIATPAPAVRPPPAPIVRPAPPPPPPAQSPAPVRPPPTTTAPSAPASSVGGVTESTATTSVGMAPQPRIEHEDAIPEPVTDEGSAARAEAQVGSRIELPKGTRRLPGGLASRLDDRPPIVISQGGRTIEVEVKGSMRSPSIAGGSAEREPGQFPAAGGAVASTTEPTADLGGRRVLRNEDGVIVGAASQRSEPKILGFIALEQRRKRQQVIITDASEEDRRGRASQRKQREERAQAQGRRKKMMRPVRGRAASPLRPSTAEKSEAKKRIRVDEAIQVSDLAHQMSQKASNVLKVLWGMGMRGITINHAIDAETAELLAAEFGYTVDNVSFQEEDITGVGEAADGHTRAPVVTMMGHVDHGKTSLLDRIRKTQVAEGEAGGITQHIGAYRVETDKGDVVFLDTPGHEAFSAMRSRGAHVTDVVVLVVAADDGVMPTTIEAIKHAREARVPLVVALNKIDKPDANPGRVKQALMEHGIVGEEFGGDTIICEVSAKSGQGIPHLLEMLAVQAEVLDLRAPLEGRASGSVIEARIDKGRGVVVTVLVQSGMLQRGDVITANEFSGKVRGLYDDRGNELAEVGPSTPVEVLGLDGVPSAGDAFNSVDSEKDARSLVTYRREQRRRKESVRSGPSIHEMIQRRKTPVLKIVLRADVQGSAEAVRQALEQLATDKVKVDVIKTDVGAINETDVKYARASEAIILGFNVKPAGKAATIAESEGVQIHTFTIIYEALDRVQEMMVGLLEPELREKEQGEAEVRQLFPIPRIGVVAGCRITKGIVNRHSRVRVIRAGEVVHRGSIGSLRVFKEDVREVKEGFECGIVVDGFGELQPGDTIQAFEVEAIRPTL